MNFLHFSKEFSKTHILRAAMLFLTVFLATSPVAARAVKELCPAPELYDLLPHSAFELEPVTGGKRQNLIAATAKDCERECKLYSINYEPKTSAINVYRQKAGKHTFYRIIISNTALQDITACPIRDGDFTPQEAEQLHSAKNTFVQLLFLEAQVKNTSVPVYLASSAYGFWEQDRDEGLWTLNYSDFMLLAKAEHTALIRLDAKIYIENALTITGDYHLRIKKENGRPTAENTALYSTIAIVKGSDYKESSLPFVNGNYFAKIQGSGYLFTPDSPLKNSMLSLFDSNKETYFTENAPSRPLWITIEFNADSGFLQKYGELRVTQSSCINGTAATESEYMQNRRIAAFSVSAANAQGKKQTAAVNLRDYRMESQTMYLPFASGFTTFEFITSDLYDKTKGTNCTLAGFNINLKGMGWLFGTNN